MTKASRNRLLHMLEQRLQLPMLVLSLLWLAIVVIELVGQGSAFLSLAGTGIWIAFLLEFGMRLSLSERKASFLRRNWLTVLALAVPALRLVRGFAALRAVRVLRGARLVRIVGTANRGMTALRATLRRRRFGSVALATLLLWVVGAAGMLSFEPAAEVEGGFSSFGDSLWWTGMLVASIGTDFWPVTPEGRLLSSVLAFYGLAVFGYITATLATFFIGRDAASPQADLAGSAEIDRLRLEVVSLRREIGSVRLTRS